MHIDPNHVPKDGPTYRPRKAPGQAELKKEVRKASFLKPWKVLQDLQEFGKQSDNVGKELLDRTRAVGEITNTLATGTEIRVTNRESHFAPTGSGVIGSLLQFFQGYGYGIAQ